MLGSRTGRLEVDAKLLATRSQLLKESDLAAVVLNIFIRICECYPSRDSEGSVIRPLPRAKKPLNDVQSLPHIVELDPSWTTVNRGRSAVFSQRTRKYKRLDNFLKIIFMEKPSTKPYPDYYRVIAEPIDMITIDANNKNDRYSCK